MFKKEPPYYGYELQKVPYVEYVRGSTEIPLCRKVLARIVLVVCFAL